jgi:phage-related protein
VRTQELKPSQPQPVVWMGDSLVVVRTFPKAVRDEIGFALYEAQRGGKHVNAKPLRGFGPGVLEVVSDYRGDTFRAVYTVRFENKIYVLHAFQKKSRKGIATPGHEIELVRRRLKQAIALNQLRED